MAEQDPGGTYPTAGKPHRHQETPSTAEARHPWWPQLGTGQRDGWPEWETVREQWGAPVRKPHLSQLSVPRANSKPKVSEEWSPGSPPLIAVAGGSYSTGL